MAQVVVYGPNGARTTANTERRPGEEKSEYERLIAGEIPGREGYKGAMVVKTHLHQLMKEKV
jgi:hypothetical protein